MSSTDLFLDYGPSFTGTSGNDVLPLTGKDNSGANYLSGLGGNDTLYGGAGDDTLDGGTGADQMFGGTGSDFYYVDNIGDKVIENVNEGYDSVSSTISYVLPNYVEVLTLYGTANINGTGNSLNNQIYGGDGSNNLNGMDGDDTIWARDGADTVLGGAGNDKLYGEAGNDLIIGGAGTDTMDGGSGFDTISYASNPTFVIVHLATGTTSNPADNGDYLSNFEAVIGSSFADELVGGFTDSAVLNGGDGSDTIRGSFASDTLIGGRGADILNGTDGNDTFVYLSTADSNQDSGIDTIQWSSDKIDLSAIDANTTIAGDQPFIFTSTGFTAGVVTYEATTHQVLAETNGLPGWDIVIQITNPPNGTLPTTLDASYFVL